MAGRTDLESQLARVLRDRYYLGFVSYKGEEYPGRHEPLVTPELFARVQAVLDSQPPPSASAAAPITTTSRARCGAAAATTRAASRA